MTEIIASVLPFATYEELKNKIAVVRGVVPVVQIDICDGIFVKSLTWPYEAPGQATDDHFNRILNEQEGLPFWEDIDFEIDLMVADSVENFDIYMKLGPRRIIFHLEAVGNLEEFKNFLEGIDNYVRDVVEIGVAFNPATPLESVFPLINSIDFVQVMGNDKIGLGGISLDEKVYKEIETLRERYPDLPIEIDIGVTDETAPLLVKAGATRLVTGSVLFKADDIIGTVERFRNL